MSSKGKEGSVGGGERGRGGKYKREGPKTLPATDATGARKDFMKDVMHDRLAIKQHMKFMWWLSSRRGFLRYSDGGASLSRGDRTAGKHQRAARRRNRTR